MTDRDHFAAAALTGMLSKSIAPEQAMSEYVRIAAAYADAMLRERERTNLDAEPAAIAEPSEWGTRREGQGTGSTQEPVAWAILHKDHQYVSLCREQAEAHNIYTDAEIVPLYAGPTLTEDEREAVSLAGSRLSADPMYANVCDVLFGLLKRTK